MEQKKSWTRWTESQKIFPTNKYNFKNILKKAGDYVETHPLSLEDYVKIKKAVHFWAWHRGYTVKTRAFRTPENMYVVYIELLAKHRHRDFL